MQGYKVLIAIDSSEYNMKVAKEGFRLAEKMKAQPALIFVVDSSKASGNVDAGITAQDALVVLKREAEMLLSEFGNLYHGDKNLLKLMPEGHPPKEIIKTAHDWQADMIVIGKQGKSGLMRLLVGSVADYVLKNAIVPVVIIPA